MSNKFKSGDKVRCIRGSPTFNLHEGRDYTVKRSHPFSNLINLEGLPKGGWCYSRFELVEATTPETSSDVLAAFVADVEAGRIKRGGVPGKYRVFRNDADNVVVEFFN